MAGIVAACAGRNLRHVVSVFRCGYASLVRPGDPESGREYPVCRTETGWTAWARRMVSGPASLRCVAEDDIASALYAEGRDADVVIRYVRAHSRDDRHQPAGREPRSTREPTTVAGT